MNVEYLIIVFIVLHLLYYAYRLQKYEHVYIDLWLYSLIMLVFPYFVLYPWAGDIENEMSIGSFIYSSRNFLREAFYCNLIGYICMWIGKYMYDSKKNKPVFCRFDMVSQTVLFCNRYLKIFILIYLPFFLIVFSLVLTYSGDILLVALRTGMIQTCTNIVTCSLPCLLSVFLIKYIEFKQKKDLIFFSLFFLLALFMGRRSITLQPITGIMLMFFIHKGKKLRLIYPIIIAIAFVFIVFWLDTLRHGESTSGETLIEKVLYGNTFCDVRDFSLILSGRNEEFLYGKTYLAGLMSFIPSSLSDFRMDWSFGHVSLKMAGLYDGGWTVHGGLRGGIFCEGYLNFGYIGIIILAIVYGYVNEWINKQNTFYSKRRMFSSAYSCKIKGTFISILMISSSAWMLYGLLLPIVIIYYVKSKNFVLGLFKPVNYK